MVFGKTIREFNVLNIAMAALAISMALISQYVFNMHPCKMCILQRIPYFIVIFLHLVFIFSTSWKYQISIKWLFVLSILSYISTAILAIYHVGIEQKLIRGPSGCSSQDTSLLSNEELLNQILNAPIVMCDDIAFELFGISMAGWNAMYGLACAVICWLAYKNLKVLVGSK